MLHSIPEVEVLQARHVIERVPLNGLHPTLRQVHPSQAAHVVFVVQPFPPHGWDVALLHHQLLHHRRSGHWLKREGWKGIETGAIQHLLKHKFSLFWYDTEYKTYLPHQAASMPGAGAVGYLRAVWCGKSWMYQQLQLQEKDGNYRNH